VVQLEGLEDELKCVRETGAGGIFQTMSLPQGMPISSSDVIANLNEHLVIALQVLLFCLLLSLFLVCVRDNMCVIL